MIVYPDAVYFTLALLWFVCACTFLLMFALMLTGRWE